MSTSSAFYSSRINPSIPILLVFSLLLTVLGIMTFSACETGDCLYLRRNCAEETSSTYPEPDKRTLLDALSTSGGKEEIPDSIETLLALVKDDKLGSLAIIRELKSMVVDRSRKLAAEKAQNVLFKNFASKGLPKGIHCLTLRLSEEHCTNPMASINQSHPSIQSRLADPRLLHFVVITDNILAASVVVRSALENGKNRKRFVFHVVTDRLTFHSMQAWFALNPASPATVEVLGVHHFDWVNSKTIPVLELLEASNNLKRYYFGEHGISEGAGQSQFRSLARVRARDPKYVSIMNHLRMYLPKVFPKLKKVVFLDDDVVVQKDLSPLWKIPLHGHVMGAVETCRGPDAIVQNKRFKMYFNFSNKIIAKAFDPMECAWGYGMNIFDLRKWRKSNVTAIYHRWQRLNMRENLQLWQLGTLPPSLIAFRNQVQPIDPKWHMLGLGYNQGCNVTLVQKAAVIHYNGGAKPWLELAYPEFRPFWSKYVNHSNEFIHQCNLNDLF